AVAVTLTGADVWAGIGGSLTGSSSIDYAISNGTLGFRATVGTLTIVSIKDLGTLLTGDETSYLGVAADNFSGDLIGLEDILVFHAWNTDLLMNRATDNNPLTLLPLPAKLNWSTFTNTGLDISLAKTALNATSLGALTNNVELSANGSVALNALSGTLVAKGTFDIRIGQVRSAALVSGNTQDANAVAVTLSGADVWAGVGGSLTGSSSADYAVSNGTLGFRASVGTLTIVSIKDLGGLLSGDETSYLGVAVDNFSGDLIGLEDVLVFHVWNTDLLMNRATDNNPLTLLPLPTKLNW